MTADADHDKLDEAHAEVRAAYHAAAFDDEPPRAVDAAILEAARNARKRRLHGYWPPLALAATVVLALGLVLRLAVPTHEAPAVTDAPEAQLAPSAPEADGISSQATSGRAESTRVRTTSPVAAPPVDVAEPVAAEERATAQQGALVYSDTADAAAATEIGAARSAIEAMRAPPSGCASELGGDADGWLVCIDALLDAGDEATARRELEAFSARYPERTVPDTIADRLAP